MISIFLPSLHGGGAERAMVNFAREISGRGWRVDLVVANAVGALRPLVPESVRLVDLRAQRMLSAAPRLVRYLRRERPQALFATITHANITAAIAARMSRCAGPLVLRQSNAPMAECKDSLGRRLAHFLLPRTYLLSDRVIAVSQGVADQLTQMDSALARKITVLPTPVLSSDIVGQGEEEPGHSWLAPGEPPVVLAAGRLMQHKGFETLLEAFLLVRRSRPARLIIIGEGIYRPQLEKKIAALGLERQVDLPGFKRNPFAFMNRAGCFVLASEYEGLPNVLIQAMAFGTPVVSTDCESGPCEILEGGRLGKLVPIGDARAMAQAISESLDLPRQVEAQESVQRRFSIAEASTAYLALAGLAPRGAR